MHLDAQNGGFLMDGWFVIVDVMSGGLPSMYGYS
jgi:hypothetical protein